MGINNQETFENGNILIARRLHKWFGKIPARVHAMRGVNLSVRTGEFLAVMGPSGSGKSTLLHILGLMSPPDEGEIELNGQIVPHNSTKRTVLRRNYIGFVFQRFNLLGVLNATDNVAISLRIRGINPDGQIDELFEKMGISHVARRKPSEMSLGEQQRVAIVRAMAHRPKLLLADEPTGNLDSTNAATLLRVLQDMNRRDNQTIIMITHSPQAAKYADRILHMKDGKLLETTK